MLWSTMAAPTPAFHDASQSADGKGRKRVLHNVRAHLHKITKLDQRRRAMRCSTECGAHKEGQASLEPAHHLAQRSSYPTFVPSTITDVGMNGVNGRNNGGVMEMSLGLPRFNPRLLCTCVGGQT